MSPETESNILLCPDPVEVPETAVSPTGTYCLSRKRTPVDRRTAGELPLELAHVACCLTVYNEPGAAILGSMAAIGRNVSWLRMRGRLSGSADLALCIVVDGITSLSASARALFREFQLYPEDPPIGADLLICERTISLAHLLDAVDVRSVGDDEDEHWLSIYREAMAAEPRSGPERERSADDVGLRVLVAFKACNRGKLDSHWWFFDRICPALDPTYCIQMDAGTAPQVDAVAQLLRALDANSRIGAAASRILINSAVRKPGYLHSWQYCDFVLQKLIEWPAEVLCGYLTVIPGQFCIFRWAALTGSSSVNAPDLPAGESPLDRYFRGLGSLGPFEANMFLAEDRILGFEILARRNCDWTLYYETHAVAVTDACTAMPELLKQRRRWTNSSLTCNVWLIANLRKYWGQSRAGLSAKLRVLGAAPWLVMNMIFQWFLPAFFALTNRNLAETLTGHFKTMPSVAGIAAVSTELPLILMVLMAAWFVLGKIDRKATALIHVYLAWQIGLLVASWAVADWLTWTAFGFEPILLLVIAGTYSGPLWRKVTANLIRYLLIRPALLAVITTYSMCNLHDCNWGTKGLDRHNATDGGIGGARLQRFRWSVLSAWIATNAGVTTMIYSSSGVNSAVRASYVLPAIGVLMGIKLFASGVAAAKVGLSRRPTPSKSVDLSSWPNPTTASAKPDIR